ncbi:MAG: STAS-like domain-containing protein [Candidatus Rokuibacteriota bacterium]
MTESIRVQIRDWVGELGALEPRLATRLALHVIELHRTARKITLDFSGAGAVSSSFANEFFVLLARVKPLDEWRDLLVFAGLASSQAQVLAKSINAARRVATRSS